MLLSNIVGSDARFKVLTMLCHQKAYQREIEMTLDLHLFAVQTQLKVLIKEGVVIKWKSENRIYYSLNPKYPLVKEVKALFVKAAKLSKGKKKK